ncbi:hypothetical protein DFH08DRAFT_886968 [Mycena albidolilacea]|uniref:SUZ domain-containing protein n=1 Tax=Mycena albidolilacea TaxID=1033008 RepID=A0AAD7EHK0_9AGAR|nr:hypothetical protein DFH08DRAFT_886968 [Mycena albidolilacea]
MCAAADWDQAAPSTSSRRPPVPKTVVPVSDDWEDDEELEEEDNQRVWADANSRAPMPSLIISGSSTTSSAAAPPPPAAFQPAMRILKRPSNAGPAAAPPPVAAGETLKEREARYQAARERIFGSDSDGGASSPGDKKDKKAGGVVRNPRGPAAPLDAETPPKGFTVRRSGNPPPSPNPQRGSDVKPAPSS